MARLILFNKPWGVLPQFTDNGGGKTGSGRASADPANAGQNGAAPRPTLSDFIPVPNVYPAGRLDRDSEGLMLLTDDGRLQARIADPKHKMPKTYLVQVEGEIDEAALVALRKGVMLNDGMTLPAMAEPIEAPDLWPRDPPIRVRLSVPDSWLRLTINEGRNRQVRRMTAAVGFPTLRLVRWQIGNWTVDGLGQGDWREMCVNGH